MFMDNFADERDQKQLEQDRYTFFVLRRILGGNCKLILTDHARLILCLSDDVHPVWIWTPDDATEAEMEKAYRLASGHALLDGACRFNLKYGLAAFFIKRAAAEGKKLSVSMNMLAYGCPAPVEPELAADGAIHRCGPADLDELVDFIELFQKETGIDQNDRAGYRKDAEAFIRAGNTFFWENAQGRHTASCKFSPNGNMAAINLVFTRPEFRRKHYAQNLVYQVTKLARGAGYIPMLYTDADYAASNACYEKIGYVLRGRLCTIGEEKQ